MSAQLDYWRECIAIAAEECELVLTEDQLHALADSAESGHDHYGMAFYSPPANERIADIEREWKQRLATLQKEFDNYRADSVTAIKQALRIRSDAQVDIGKFGEVTLYEGRTVKIQ